MTLSRDFSLREKILLVFLGVVLIGICYYWFVDQPVRDAITKAHSEKNALDTELTSARTRVEEMRTRQAELDEISSGGDVSRMESYNNSKQEMKFLNDVLSDTLRYSITFSDVTRDGDQIRRGFSLSFTAVNYDSVKEILTELTNCEYRCLIGDLQCSGLGNDKDTRVTISATATFYETLVGGTPDTGLPADSAATY